MIKVGLNIGGKEIMTFEWIYLKYIIYEQWNLPHHHTLGLNENTFCVIIIKNLYLQKAV